MTARRAGASGALPDARGRVVRPRSGGRGFPFEGLGSFVLSPGSLLDPHGSPVGPAELVRVMNKNQLNGVPDRELVSLRWISNRWNCSRQTCRRVLERACVMPLFLGGDGRNATLRFDLQDVLAVERASQGVDQQGEREVATGVRSGVVA